MKIKVSLTGVLNGFVPEDTENKITVPEDGFIEVPEGTTGAQLLELLDLEQSASALVIDNSVTQTREQILEEGSWVTILGYVGGG